MFITGAVQALNIHLPLANTARSRGPHAAAPGANPGTVGDAARAMSGPPPIPPVTEGELAIYSRSRVCIGTGVIPGVGILTPVPPFFPPSRPSRAALEGRGVDRGRAFSITPVQA